MPVEVIMPKVDMDMTEGAVAAWHVAEGETVAKGAALFDIETDKAAMEVESPASGVLRHVRAKPGDRAPVGAAIAWIYAEGEAAEAPPGAAAPAPEAAAQADAGPVRPAEVARPAAVAETQAEAAGLRATPAARAAARAAGLALEHIAGSGPRARVQRADVEAAVAAEARRAAAVAPAVAEPAAPVRAGAPAAPRSGEDAPLHVSRRAGTGTPVLFVHGFAADSQGWAPLEKHLPGDLALLRLDLPGHGRSPRPRIEGFADLLKAARRAFDALDLDRVHLVGHSLGGAVALGLADVRPRQVASLTLIAPAGLGAEIDGAALDGIARARRVESLAPWLKRLTGSPDALGWDFARAAMLARSDEGLRAAQAEMAQALFPDGTQGFDLTAALRRVEAPTAILWGRQDRIIPWRHALEAPGEAALHLLDGLGHVPHVEDPARVARLIAPRLR